MLDLFEPIFKHFFDLPMPVGEIAQNDPEFSADRARVECDDFARQPMHALKVGTRGLPRQMERPHNDAGRVGVEP